VSTAAQQFRVSAGHSQASKQAARTAVQTEAAWVELSRLGCSSLAWRQAGGRHKPAVQAQASCAQGHR
jgi:N-acetylglucosamine-6-phosphate deacetylase